MASGFKDTFDVEWIAVTYRSVAAVVLLLVLGGGGAGGYYFYFYRWAPKQKAVTAVDNAQIRLNEAEGHRGDPMIDEVLDTAAEALATARVELENLNYSASEVAAIRSGGLSTRVLHMAKGEEEGSTEVGFYSIEGDVRVKRAGEFNWRRATEDMKLDVGDQVKTSRAASARVIYFDGTVTTVQPGSLMEIRDLYEDPVTKVRRVREKLTWGEVQASTQTRNVKGSFHEVATDQAVARSEDAGEFRVAYDQDKKTSTLDVFDGRIEIATGNSKAAVDAGERITADSTGSLSAKETLPGVPRLLTPSDQRVFIFDDPESETISLGWQPIDGANGYRLQIATGALFTEPLYDAERQGDSALVSIGPGSFYWKVAAINEDGIEGPYSKARRFRISSQPIRDRTDAEPPRLEITEFVPVGQMVIINGVTEPGVTLWIDDNKVEVSEDGAFNAVVRLRQEGVNDLEIVAQDTAGNEARLSRSAFLEVF